MKSPVARSIPAFRAAARPAFGCSTTITSGDVDRATSVVSSGDPSLTTTISTPEYVWASALRIAFASTWACAKQGMTTETEGRFVTAGVWSRINALLLPGGAGR